MFSSRRRAERRTWAGCSPAAPPAPFAGGPDAPGAGCPGVQLPALPLGQQGRHLTGFQQARQAEVVLLLDRTGRGGRAELTPVEEHPVEGRLGLQRLEAQLLLIAGGVAATTGLADQRVLGAWPSRSGRSSTWSRSASISAAYCSSEGTEGRNSEAVSPRRRARTNRPTAWAKNSGVEMLVA